MNEKVFKACIKCIEEHGFNSFTFAKASQESGIPIHIFHEHFKAPIHVIIYLFKKIDDKVLKEFEFTEEIPTKDQLFDILMLRFEVSEPFKTVLKSFWENAIFLPNDYPPLLCKGLESMSWMLDAVGMQPKGIVGLIRSQGLLGIYLFTLKVWLIDDTPDLGKTMAALDKGLSTMETAAKVINSLDDVIPSSGSI